MEFLLWVWNHWIQCSARLWMKGLTIKDLWLYPLQHPVEAWSQTLRESLLALIIFKMEVTPDSHLVPLLPQQNRWYQRSWIWCLVCRQTNRFLALLFVLLWRVFFWWQNMHDEIVILELRFRSASFQLSSASDKGLLEVPLLAQISRLNSCCGYGYWLKI